MNKKILIPIFAIFLSTGCLISCGQEPPVEPKELAIINQPKNIEIDNGEAMTMNVTVNNPKLVKSYQWYYALYDDGQYEYEDPILGSKAQSDTFYLPAHFATPSTIEAYRCEIVDINGKTLTSDWGLVRTKPGKENIDQIVLGDYPILPGKTLDLASTPYGSGTISLNATSDHVTFNNVYFTNEKFDSNITAIGFCFTKFNPTTTNFTFEFIGDNHFSNTYWEDDRFDGGSSIIINALDLDAGKEVTATFTGSGSVSFYGGSYGIITNFVNVIQDIDMAFYAQPEKYTGGIYCDGYTLKKDRTLTANLNRRVIDAKGDVNFEENSYVLANLGVAECGPKGSVDLVNTVGNVFVKNSSIKINTLLNVKKEIENEINVSTWGFVCEDITIEDSLLEVSILEYNNDVIEIPDYFVSTITSGGISGEHVEILNSTYNVKIKGEFINESRAVNCRSCTVDKSLVNFDIKGNTAGGFCCYSVNSGIDTTFKCGDSDINITLFNNEFAKDPTVKTPPFDNGGIYAGAIVFTSGDNNQIVIKTNGIQTICLKTGEIKGSIKPHADYNKQFIKFDNATLTSTKAYVHNEETYSSASLMNPIYETLYEDLGSGNYKYLDNITVTYWSK